MISLVLCWLGFHQILVTHPGARSAKLNGGFEAAHGRCVRCNQEYDWYTGAR